jgi:hypothetical protein
MITPRDSVNTWQGGVKVISPYVFKIKTPRGHGTGFYLGKFGNGLIAVATALHVIDVEFDLGGSMKLVHSSSAKEILLNDVNNRVIFPYPKSDIAIIVFIPPMDWEMPEQYPEHLQADSKLFAGVEVGWLGFPAVKSDTLSFFHGYVSSVLSIEERYLVDGVAINGVSGGPVFFLDVTDKWPKIAGIITAYIPNRTFSDSLPGVSMVSAIPQEFDEQIKRLKDLPQVAKVAEEKTEQQPETSELPEDPRLPTEEGK